MVLESDTRRCANKDAEPRRGVDMRWCASNDVGSRKGWIGGSHIDWRRERVSAKMLGPEGGGGVVCEILQQLERGTQHSL